MNTFTSTYRQTWKVGLVILCAALGSAFLATRAEDRPATQQPVQTNKTVSQISQPMFGSNAWFGLYANDAGIVTD